MTSAEARMFINRYKKVVYFISNHLNADQSRLEMALENLKTELLKIMPAEEVEQVLDRLYEEA